MIFGLVALAAIVLVTFALNLSPQALRWLQFTLATPVMFYVGGPYFTGAWQRLRRSKPCPPMSRCPTILPR